MSKITTLPFLFTTVAVIEALYATLGLLIPPDFVLSLTGWVLNPDGQWVVKLMGAALGFQAIIAWLFRKDPHLGVAWALAAYQLLAATIDWVMWLWLLDVGIFSTPLAQTTVVASIIIHYTLGILLIIGIQKQRKVIQAQTYEQQNHTL